MSVGAFSLEENMKHLFTKAGAPIIHTTYHSYVFENNAPEALVELNQVILHLKRLIEKCPHLVEMDSHS